MTTQTISCIAISPFSGDSRSTKNRLFVAINERENRPYFHKVVSGFSAARLARWLKSRANRGTYEFEVTQYGDKWYRWWNVSEQPK